MFKSPTCTQRDIAAWPSVMARIANVSLEELGQHALLPPRASGDKTPTSCCFTGLQGFPHRRPRSRRRPGHLA
ncbi:MAG: hypothetical protein ACLSHG_10450 [Oscillospiraceae bacterium]